MMGLSKLGYAAVAAAGTNYMFIDLPEGAELVTIAAINGNTPNLEFRMDLARVSDSPSDGSLDAIPILHGYQDALLTAIWHAGQPYEVGGWRRVVCTFFGCTAGDGIAMAVGFDS